eukprot:scaffold4269_cov168-Amphora_coffeaeformis.AAC.5
MLASTTSAGLRRWVSRQATAPSTRRGMASTVAKMAAPQQSSTARGFALAAGVAVAGYTMLPREETVRDGRWHGGNQWVMDAISLLSVSLSLYGTCLTTHHTCAICDSLSPRQSILSTTENTKLFCYFGSGQKGR